MYLCFMEKIIKDYKGYYFTDDGKVYSDRTGSTYQNNYMKKLERVYLNHKDLIENEMQTEKHKRGRKRLRMMLLCMMNLLMVI